jgi:CheY-like chemotaxis protein
MFYQNLKAGFMNRDPIFSTLNGRPFQLYSCLKNERFEMVVFLATRDKFNLYLLNYHLPDGDGLEIALLIKNFDPETPILFVAGTNYISEKQALMVGAEGLLEIDSSSFLVDLEKKVSALIED